MSNPLSTEEKTLKKIKAFRISLHQAYLIVMCLMASCFYFGISVGVVILLDIIPLLNSLACAHKRGFLTTTYLSFLDMGMSLAFLMNYLVKSKKK